MSRASLVTLAVLVVTACGPSGSPDIRSIMQPPVPDATADTSRDTPLTPSETAIVPSDAGTDLGPDLDAAAPDLPVAPVDSAPASDVESPKRAAGDPCAAGPDCATGFCVDRVCCATACTGRCFTCNRPGSVGSCSAVPTGEDPRNECMPDAIGTCGRDGTCDGNGACRLYLPQTECEPGGCSTPALEKSARLCDGNGVCQPGTTRACTGTTCQAGSCGTACTNSSQCLSGFHCEGNACRLKRALGEACTAGAQCASNNCVTGICCDTACDKACFSCKQASKPGTCLPAPNGEDPGDRCGAEPMSSCGRDGFCDGSGACRLWGQGVECGVASCAGAAATSGRACDGRGTCSAATRTDCGAYACNGVRCGTTCSGTMGCAPGFSCSGTTCLPLGLGLRWNFDEETGTVAADASGNNRAGTYVGPTPSTDVRAMMFPNPRSRAFAAKQVVQITPMPTAFNTLAGLTISVFYKSGNPPSEGDGSELVSLADNHLLRLMKGGGFEVTKRTADKKRHKCTVMIPAAIDNNWHHVATTIEVSGIKLYFDGVLQTCTLTPSNPLPSIALGADLAGNFTAGRHGSQPPQTPYDFIGNLDEVRLYTRALSASEITALAAGAL